MSNDKNFVQRSGGRHSEGLAKVFNYGDARLNCLHRAWSRFNFNFIYFLFVLWYKVRYIDCFEFIKVVLFLKYFFKCTLKNLITVFTRLTLVSYMAFAEESRSRDNS